MIIGSKQYKMDQVLDLTKQETRNLLGIRSRQILLPDGPKALGFKLPDLEKNNVLALHSS